MTTMSTPANILLYGSPISTFVRKVQLLLEHKGLDYRMEMPDRDRLLAMNPLGKVPVLSHGGQVIVDSSVICDYLERCYPQVPLFPADNRERARALWLEEYCDSPLQDACYPYVNEVVFKPLVYGQATDEAARDAARELAGSRLDYLEQQLVGDYLVGERLSIADLTLGAVMVNPLRYGFVLDPERWPKLAPYLDRLYASEPFASCLQRAEQDYKALESRGSPK